MPPHGGLCQENGKPRRTVDFQALNLHATRETHHTQSPFHQVRSIPSGKKKCVFDCWNGYHSVPLHANDRHLTTFITPWGRYRYKTAPQGYIASGDGYSRRFGEIVSDMPNKTKVIDDTLLWASTLTNSFHQAVNWLDICGRHGITLNSDKFVFGQNDLSQTIPAPVATCTPLPCNVQYFSTETHPTLTPNYPLPNAFLVDLLKTLYRSFLVATDPTLPGGKPSLLEKKH